MILAWKAFQGRSDGVLGGDCQVQDKLRLIVWAPDNPIKIVNALRIATGKV